MTSTIKPLKVGKFGRVRNRRFSRDKISITYNKPFPTRSGNFGSGAMMGVIMHTEVGFDHNVVNEFNTLSDQASATFSIDGSGHVHQYGPIGKGWYAWAQEAGNRAWYSIEHEDGGHPTVPLTRGQVLSCARIVEVLSNYAGFPLRVTDSVSEPGFGVHFMGGEAWGGHTCPDVPPKPVRSRQRAAILEIAHQIRAQR